MNIISKFSREHAAKFVFGRPINSFQLPIVTLVGGQNDLSDLNLVYSALAVLGTRAETIIVGKNNASSAAKHKLSELSDGVLDLGSRADSSDTLAAVEANSSLAVIGVGTSLSSSVQIILESWCNSATIPTIIFDSLCRLLVLNEALSQKDNLILMCSSIEFVKLCNGMNVAMSINPARGIYNYADNFTRLCVKIPNLKIAVYDSKYLYVFDAYCAEQMYLIGISDLPIGVVTGVFAALIANSKRELKDFSVGVRATAYILEVIAKKETTNQKDLTAELARTYQNLSE